MFPEVIEKIRVGTHERIDRLPNETVQPDRVPLPVVLFFYERKKLWEEMIRRDVFEVTDLHKADDLKHYWLDRSPVERIEAIEFNEKGYVWPRSSFRKTSKSSYFLLNSKEN
jgi:hypothetical protein